MDLQEWIEAPATAAGLVVGFDQCPDLRPWPKRFAAEELVASDKLRGGRCSPSWAGVSIEVMMSKPDSREDADFDMF